MLYYISIIVYVYFFPFFVKKYPIIVYPFLIAPIVLFSTFRGESGKDTPTYIARFFHSELLTNSFDSEPVLSILIKIGRFFDYSDPYVFFMFHALLVSSLYYFICRKLEISRVFVFVIGPVFLVDGLTNGMRVVIMYYFLILSVLYGRRALFYILALSSHITAILGVFLFKVISVISKSSIIKIVVFFIMLLIGLIVFFKFESNLLSFFPRAFSKLDHYSEASVTFYLSGISDLYLIFVLIMLISFYNRITYSKVVLDLLLAVLFCFVLFYLISLSSAFLRVNKFIIISLCFYPYVINARKKIPTLILILIGLPYTFNFLRQVIFGHGFLPYGGF